MNSLTQDLIINPVPLGTFVLSLAGGYLNESWVRTLLYSLAVLLVVAVLVYAVFLYFQPDELDNARHYFLVGLLALVLGYIGMAVGEKMGGTGQATQEEIEEVKSTIERAKEQAKDITERAQEKAKTTIENLQRQIENMRKNEE